LGVNLLAEFQVGSKEHAATWLAVAKDGAMLPPRLNKTSEASIYIASGETYDFEFRSRIPGEIPLQIKNLVNQATLVSKFVAQ